MLGISKQNINILKNNGKKFLKVITISGLLFIGYTTLINNTYNNTTESFVDKTIIDSQELLQDVQNLGNEYLPNIIAKSQKDIEKEYIQKTFEQTKLINPNKPIVIIYDVEAPSFTNNHYYNIKAIIQEETKLDKNIFHMYSSQC